MRGVAALLVVVSHLSHAGQFLVPGLDLGGVGKPGVYLFFVLSAFLLTRQLLGRTRDELAAPALWRRYFLRRFLRVFPLFAFVLVTSYCVGRWLGLSLPFPISGEELLAHLTLRAGKSVLWSIPPEFEYYFVLPLFGAACVIWRERLAAVVAASLAVVAAALWLWPAQLAVDNAAYLGPYLPIFLLGSLAALAHRSVVARPGTRRAAEGVAWASLLLAALTVPSLYGALTGAPVPSDRFHGERVFYGTVWSAFLVGTLAGSGVARAALSVRWLRYVGLISFSVYLWHVAVIRVVRNLSPLPPGANAWLSLAAIALVATASHFAIERPFLRLGATRSARPPG